MKDKNVKSKKKTGKAKKAGKKAKSIKKKPKMSEMAKEVKKSLEYVLQQEKQESCNNIQLHVPTLLDFVDRAYQKHNFVTEQCVCTPEKGCLDEEEQPKNWYDSFLAMFGFKRKS